MSAPTARLLLLLFSAIFTLAYGSVYVLLGNYHVVEPSICFKMCLETVAVDSVKSIIQLSFGDKMATYMSGKYYIMCTELLDTSTVSRNHPLHTLSSRISTSSNRKIHNLKSSSNASNHGLNNGIQRVFERGDC
jgi:hypothetical protein